MPELYNAPDCNWWALSGFSFRVEEYISAGKEKDVVDLDPSKINIYTRRKQRQESKHGNIDGQHTLKPSIISYPTTGWSTKLERVPIFTKAEINELYMLYL